MYKEINYTNWLIVQFVWEKEGDKEEKNIEDISLAEPREGR